MFLIPQLRNILNLPERVRNPCGPVANPTPSQHPRLYSGITRAAILALALVLVPAVALAGEIIPGPATADVVRVYDGDTLTVDAHPWPQITVRTSVRVDGVDAPEIRGKCDSEKAMAREARELARETAGATRWTAPTRPLSTPAVYSSMETKTTRFCSSLTPSGVST